MSPYWPDRNRKLNKVPHTVPSELRLHTSNFQASTSIEGYLFIKTKVLDAANNLHRRYFVLSGSMTSVVSSFDFSIFLNYCSSFLIVRVPIILLS